MESLDNNELPKALLVSIRTPKVTDTEALESSPSSNDWLRPWASRCLGPFPSGKPVILFCASTLALWTLTGIAFILGSTLKKTVPIKLLNGIAATGMAVVGGLLLARVS